jgi:NAD+ diphosphatase
MKFTSGYIENRKRLESDYAFIFRGRELLVSGERVPTLQEAKRILPAAGGLFIGSIERHNCYLFSIPEDSGGGEEAGTVTDGLSFVVLRHYVGSLDSEMCAAACFGSHLFNWELNSRYCGHCGAPNGWYDKERARICPQCGRVEFPRISPAIIIAVIKDSNILLGQNRNFPEGRYSLLAGFLEIGETIEEAAAREVKEETGIEIENVKYLASQNWPFPDSLMIGLTADYKSGEIVPDGEEIIHAGWYNPDNFPSIPGCGTIARKIINEYTKTYKS